MDDGKLRTDRLPGKRLNGLFDFNWIDGDLFFSHVEHFQVVVDATNESERTLVKCYGSH